MRLAEIFNEASIFSVGESQPQSNDFVKRSDEKGIKNAWRFTSLLLEDKIGAFTSSPEFVRYQVSLHSFIHSFFLVCENQHHNVLSKGHFAFAGGFDSPWSAHHLFLPSLCVASFHRLSIPLP